MTSERLKVLLIIESCNPEWASVPLVGYNFYEQISAFADVTLVTHQRNEAALRRRHPNADIVYIQPGKGEAGYYRTIARMSSIKGRVIWPLRHALQYPLYHFFDGAVNKMFKEKVQKGHYDLVHTMTPMMPRFPYSIVQNAGTTPTVIGPVNGGVPFPKAFKSVGLKEFSYLNFLRNIGSYTIPGYRSTYKAADLILAGSSYTEGWIRENLDVPSHKTRLFFENGVLEKSFAPPRNREQSVSLEHPLELLFVGRLEPYKGCDMILKALRDVAKHDSRFKLTIVGDGSEKQSLMALTKELNLEDKVNFTGWVSQPETFEYYQSADVFCFPSVREFGGAVVMEAMACGLPCIVVDNGGIGEYVDHNNNGIKIEPKGVAYVVEKLAESLKQLLNDENLLQQMSHQAYADARKFSWVEKGREMAALYRWLVASKKVTPTSEIPPAKPAEVKE